MNDVDAYRIEVEARRGDQVESRHVVFAAAIGAGSVRGAAFSPDRLPAPNWRSAAKPFQLLPLLTAGGRERFGFDDADLAVMAASHDGTEEHARRVADILRRVGLGPDALRCGVHRPYYLDDLPPQSPEALRPFGPLHNNCSGNHAAMLALALLHGVEPSRYLDPQSEGQRRIHAVVESLTGATPGLAIDNCAAPCYSLPLARMAEAYRFLAQPRHVRELVGSRRARLENVADMACVEAALEGIAQAMASQPQWLTGARNAATRIARLAPGELVLKHGAEGVLCVADRRRDAALALKVADGNARALVPALLFLLARLAWLSDAQLAPVEDLVEPLLRGRVGQVVGSLHAVAAGE